jgi:hypothetical protein
MPPPPPPPLVQSETQSIPAACAAATHKAALIGFHQTYSARHSTAASSSVIWHNNSQALNAASTLEAAPSFDLPLCPRYDLGDSYNDVSAVNVGTNMDFSLQAHRS